MKKKHLKLFKKHKSVETTKSVVKLISEVEGYSVSKIVLTSAIGVSYEYSIGKTVTNRDVKLWLLNALESRDIVMIEYYHKNHPNGGIKDTFHRLGGLPDIWALFLIFENEII